MDSLQSKMGAPSRVATRFTGWRGFAATGRSLCGRGHGAGSGRACAVGLLAGGARVDAVAQRSRCCACDSS